MIDGVKINISSKLLSELIKVEGIEFNGSYDRLTGEVHNYPLRGRLGTFYLKVTKTRKTLRGSLHKDYNHRINQIESNSNDFGVSELQEEIQYLSDILRIVPNDLILENLEYGVNLPFETDQTFFKKNVIVFDGHEPSISKKIDGDYYLEFRRSQWSLKFYSKEQGTILRIEKRVIKSDFIKKWGIRSLEDLTPDTLNSLRSDLINSFSKFLIVDQLDPTLKDFTAKEKNIFTQGTNPKYWQLLRSNRHRSQKSRFNSSLRNLLKSKGLNTQAKTIQNMIIEKSAALIKRNVLTDMKKCSNATILPVYEKSDHSGSIMRTCLVTGIDLTYQSKESKFLWENQIVTIANKDPSFFLELQNRFLTSDRTYKSRYDIAYYIAHNIRNRYWNLTYRIAKGKIKYEHSLFPLTHQEILQIKKYSYAL